MADKKMIVFEPGLPNTPGWTSLSDAKKEWLQERNSNLNKYLSAEGLSAANSAVELYEIKQGLQGEKLGITDFLRYKFKQHERTGFRRIEVVEKLISAGWTLPMIRGVGAHLYLNGGAGIGLGELVPIAGNIPAIRNVTEDNIKEVVEKKIRPQLTAIKSARRTGKTIKLSEDDGLKILFNSGRRIFRAMKGVNTSAERKIVLKTVTGWWMEDLAVPGAIECKRISIPEGTVAQVGRPPKGKGKKVA